MLQPGDKFPDFELQNQEGKTRRLKDYAGQWLVLYVYPKDDTPGCTHQGKAFTTSRADFENIGVKVVGLSADDVESHRNFCKKYGLTVELLADPQAQLLSQIGAGFKEQGGVKYWNRSTFVIDPKGHVRRVYENVRPQGHEGMLLEDIRGLQLTTPEITHA